MRSDLLAIRSRSRDPYMNSVPIDTWHQWSNMPSASSQKSALIPDTDRPQIRMDRFKLRRSSYLTPRNMMSWGLDNWWPHSGSSYPRNQLLVPSLAHLGRKKPLHKAAFPWCWAPHELSFSNSVITKPVVCACMMVETGSHLTKWVPVFSYNYFLNVSESDCVLLEEPILHSVRTTSKLCAAQTNRLSRHRENTVEFFRPEQNTIFTLAAFSMRLAQHLNELPSSRRCHMQAATVLPTSKTILVVQKAVQLSSVRPQHQSGGDSTTSGK